jgi:hypothetical protein
LAPFAWWCGKRNAPDFRWDDDLGGADEAGRDAAELGDQPGLRLPAKKAKRPHKKASVFGMVKAYQKKIQIVTVILTYFAKK